MPASQRLLLTLSVVVAAFVIHPRGFAVEKGLSASTLTIVAARDGSAQEELAARELRRYLYLRTGRLAPIMRVRQMPSGIRQAIVIGCKDRPLIQTASRTEERLARQIETLRAQEYFLKTLEAGNVVVIAGGDAMGTLYGAYRFAEHLGIRFYLHGDVVPDRRTVEALPVVAEHGRPLFETRGIQPFHDFPEGPDWWNLDDYKAILAQLPKLRMNFFGLHTYPEGGVGPEPTVWIGSSDDVNSDGTVRFASRSSYQNTLRGNWGYVATKTSDFSFGSAQLFERDDYGPEVMFGAIPWPETSEERNAVFNRTGQMLHEAFTLAHLLGTQTCVGTETPLIIPEIVKERLRSKGKDPADMAVVREVYEGMFQRIKTAYPVDYYWFWTPESWTWGNPRPEEVQATMADLKAAIAAAENVSAPFTLATCGWVLGPPQDRALFDNMLPKTMPMSCINRNVGFAPVEPGFARVQGRPQWAIPWLEDDPGMIIPQLWVGRMRRDAADALAYGCTGLLGIHWRTRVLAPNVSALAHAAWEQEPWNPSPGKLMAPPSPKKTQGRAGGNVAAFPNNPMADTEDDVLYQTVAYGMSAYRVGVPNGTYAVRLRFCEPHYTEAGKRVFGVALQGQKVIDSLDIFETVGQNRALDYTFAGVGVSDEMLEIRFDSIVEFPCIAAFVVEGQGVIRKVNCGGPAYAGYAGDMSDTGNDLGPRDLSAEDFYADWVRTQFGTEAAEPLTALFVKLDGGPNAGIQGRHVANLPRPATWVNGPGGIVPDTRPWVDVEQEYAFVDEMAALRPRIEGAGHLERFDYWLNTFGYLKAVGQVNCSWARFNAVIDAVREEQDEDKRRQLALTEALPLREALVEQVAEVHRLMLSTITTTGGMGTVANWQQHILPSLLTEPGAELSAALGQPLAPDARPAGTYGGTCRLVVPTVRSLLMAGEDLKLKVILLGSEGTSGGTLHWRPLGESRFARIPLRHVGRSVYSVVIPSDRLGGKDFEYYVEATSPSRERLVFPATAPQVNQTVVHMPTD